MKDKDISTISSGGHLDEQVGIIAGYMLEYTLTVLSAYIQEMMIGQRHIILSLLRNAGCLWPGAVIAIKNRYLWAHWIYLIISLPNSDDRRKLYMDSYVSIIDQGVTDDLK